MFDNTQVSIDRCSTLMTHRQKEGSHNLIASVLTAFHTLDQQPHCNINQKHRYSLLPIMTLLEQLFLIMVTIRSISSTLRQLWKVVFNIELRKYLYPSDHEMLHTNMTVLRTRCIYNNCVYHIIYLPLLTWLSRFRRRIMPVSTWYSTRCSTQHLPTIVAPYFCTTYKRWDKKTWNTFNWYSNRMVFPWLNLLVFDRSWEHVYFNC